MLHYIKFLFNDFDSKDANLNKIKNILVKDEESYKVLINCILTTELKIFFKKLIDYNQEEYNEINSNMNMVELDNNLKNYYNMIDDTLLNSYASNHYNSLWRIAAISIWYLLKCNKIFRKI